MLVGCTEMGDILSSAPFISTTHPQVWGKTGGKLYGQKSGADFLDNQQRFLLFNKAALEALRKGVLPFSPGDNTVVVANDWHTAIFPVILKAQNLARKLIKFQSYFILFFLNYLKKTYGAYATHGKKIYVQLLRFYLKFFDILCCCAGPVPAKGGVSEDEDRPLHT